MRKGNKIKKKSSIHNKKLSDSRLDDHITKNMGIVLLNTEQYKKAIFSPYFGKLATF